MSYRTNWTEKRRLTRDINHKLLTGVCAGIADYYQAPKLAIRVITVLCFMSLPVLVAISYIVAAMVMPKSGVIYHVDN